MKTSLRKSHESAPFDGHLSTCAGIHTSGSPLESYNLEGPYFKVVFGFIGISDVTIVHAGGTNKVAQGQIPEPALLEQFAHQVDLAASK